MDTYVGITIDVVIGNKVTVNLMVITVIEVV